MNKNRSFQRTESFHKALFILTLISCSCINAQDTIRCLAIGNSFSEDAVEDHLHKIARAENRIFIVGNLHIPSCSLEKHWKNAANNSPAYSYWKIDENGISSTKKDYTLDSALTNERWDYISLQQVSFNSGILYTYFPYLPNLVNHIKEKATNPNLQLVFHQTWPYSQNSTLPGFSYYDNDPMKMYKYIVETINTAAWQAGINVIIPSGTVIQHGKEFFGDQLYRDYQHLSIPLGRYIVACTWFEALTGINVVGNTYTPPDITEENIEIIQNLVHDILSSQKDIPENFHWKDSTEIKQNPFFCMRLGENVFYLNASINKKTEAHIELISIDGQSRTIFNEPLEEGDLKLIFLVPKGIFSLRLTTKDQHSKSIKIINP